MQKILLFGVVGVLLGIGGTILFVTYFTKGPSLSSNELFEKKQECAKLKENIQKDQPDGSEVRESFYSKKMNTCLYIVERPEDTLLIDRFYDDAGYTPVASVLSDFVCTNTFVEMRGECRHEIEEFNKKVKELKGE